MNSLKNKKMRLQINEDVTLKHRKEKVFCQESYAQDLYNRMSDIPTVQKDVYKGQVIPVHDLTINDSNDLFVDTMIGVPINIDIRKEKKFFVAVGFNEADLEMSNMKQLVSAGWFKDFFKKMPSNITIENNDDGIRGSLYSSFLESKRQEFFKQITENKAYYMCKIMDKNKGGFFIKVLGIDAFLPGSLAAANKIVDFESFIDKEIPVMVEDYLP